MSYCIDSSSLIAAWEERYPPDNFPKFWEYMKEAIESGLVVVPEAVLDETQKRSTELHKWLKGFSDKIVKLDEPIQLKAKEILKQFPKLVAERKVAFAADPFVIATAITQKKSVITEEGNGSPAKPKIPDACRALNVKPFNLIHLIKSERWIIS